MSVSAGVKSDAVKSEINVAIITDTHLVSIGLARGCDTSQSLVRVLSAIKNLNLPLSAIVHLGDVSNTVADGREGKVYRSVAASVSELGLPTYWVPGNHDDPATFMDTLPFGAHEKLDTKPCDYTFTVGHQRFLVLDARIDEDPMGCLSSKQLDFAQKELLAFNERVIVLAHYPMMDTGVAWHRSFPGDHRPCSMLTENGADLHKALVSVDEAVRVPAVICGHVHAALSQSIDGISYLTAPSVAPAIRALPNSSMPELDLDVPPGFLLLCIREHRVSWQYHYVV